MWAIERWIRNKVPGCFSQRNCKQIDEIRFVIIGKTGAGKSATANSLIGKRDCSSRLLGSSETRDVKKVEGFRDGRKLLIVDTPGLLDTRQSNDEESNGIMKCIGMSSPGPHIVLLVIQIGRISQEEQDTVDRFIEYFGEHVFRFMIVVFTRMDEIIQDEETLEQFIGSLPDKLRNILGRCGNRYLGFNNMALNEDNEKQLINFFTIVDKTITQNSGSCYTNQIYHKVEADLKKRMKEHKRDSKSNNQCEKRAKIQEIHKDYQNRGPTVEGVMAFPNRNTDPLNINMQRYIGDKDQNNQLFTTMDVKGMQIEKKENESEHDFIERRIRLVQEAMHVQHQKEIAQLKQKMEEDKRRVIREIIKIYEGKMKADDLRETEVGSIDKDNSAGLNLAQRWFPFWKSPKN